MTDPIRIPLGNYTVVHDPGGTAWPRTGITITPDIARRIVALAQSGDATPIGDGTAANPIRLPTAAPPVADDEAAVTAMSRAYASQMPEGFRPALTGIRCVLSAIKAGKVPGICCDNDPNALSRRIAQECADALGKLKQVRADLAAETDAKNRALTCAANYAEEVEELKADLAACRAKLADATERAEADNREINRLANIVADDGEKLATLTAQRDRLAGLLREAKPMTYGIAAPIFLQSIDAALAELGKTK